MKKIFLSFLLLLIGSSLIAAEYDLVIVFEDKPIIEKSYKKYSKSRYKKRYKRKSYKKSYKYKRYKKNDALVEKDIFLIIKG